LLFAAGAIGEVNNMSCQAANIIEYIHTATLLHDDVVDNADLRRSKKSARTIWGNEASVLVGDYLFTVSFKYLAAFKNLRMVEELSKATTLMARGEILQLTRSNDSATEEDYLEIVYHKTASLMGAAMALGVISAKGTEEQQQAFYDCGKHIGMAFQLIDDALDYDLDNQSLGKQQGADLKERKITLPLSHLLKTASETDREIVLDILDEDEITDAHVLCVGKLVQKYGSAEYTKKRAEDYINQAKKDLTLVPQNEYRKSIDKLADFIVFRKQ
ncbi:MAG: polyprenyl synthetase, partial [SAR324 cluster bacterium]